MAANFVRADDIRMPKMRGRGASRMNFSTDTASSCFRRRIFNATVRSRMVSRAFPDRSELAHSETLDELKVRDSCQCGCVACPFRIVDEAKTATAVWAGDVD